MRRILTWMLILIAAAGTFGHGTAESLDGYEEAYILCSVNDYVNVRMKPTTRSQSLGRFETGDRIWLDGKKKNGFLHCVHLGLEMDEGWIHSGFVVYDPPEYIGRSATIVCRGRLAARKYVGGKRTRWLKSGATVKVHFWSDEWALTNCGYVRSEYLELEGI